VAGAETASDVGELVDTAKLMEGIDEGTIAQLHYFMHLLGDAVGPFESFMREIQVFLGQKATVARKEGQEVPLKTEICRVVLDAFAQVLVQGFHM
jgi:hypothetical protein